MSKRIASAAVMTVILTATLGWQLSADEKSAREGIAKLAKALEKNEPAAKVLIDSLKKETLEDLMLLHKLRKQGGFGVGDKPQTILPDGIELKIITLSKKTLGTKLAVEEDAISEAAYRVVAIAEVIAHKCPLEKPKGGKDPKDWAKWSKGMKEAALDLAKAAKSENTRKVEDAAAKLHRTCKDCHGVFRD